MPKKTPRVDYIGERTGDNMQVTPLQLLDMIREEIERGDDPVEGPIKGMLAIIVREDEQGTLHMDRFRCQLPKFVEIAVISRTWQRTIGAIGEGD